MRKIICLLFICLTHVSARADIVTISIAKSGTNLLDSLIYSLSGIQRTYAPSVEQLESSAEKLTNQGSELFFTTHFQHQYVVDFILHNSIFDKIIINIRDPRDVLVSAAFFYSLLPVCDNDFPSCGLLIVKNLFELSIQDRIKLLLSPPENRISTPVYDIKAACDFISQNQHLFGDRFFLTRYEDLVRADSNSIEVCSELANFLGYSTYSKQFIESAIHSSVGNSPTFREGKTGSWKNFFDEELKALFKDLLGDELILLGYETDHNW